MPLIREPRVTRLNGDCARRNDAVPFSALHSIHTGEHVVDSAIHPLDVCRCQLYPVDSECWNTPYDPHAVGNDLLVDTTEIRPSLEHDQCLARHDAFASGQDSDYRCFRAQIECDVQ
jgi:hypothetical protein